MTRCPEFYDKLEKDGDFCGYSPGAISQIKAYKEMRIEIGKHIPDKDFVITNFPEFASRAITAHAKDGETRAWALDYVVHCLKRGEKVSNGDLAQTIKEHLKSSGCTVEQRQKKVYVRKEITDVSEVKPVTLHPNLEATTLKDRIADINNVSIDTPNPSNSTGLEMQQVAAQGPPKPKPVPCLEGKPCQHMIKGKFGRECDMVHRPINQLPGDRCPFELKEEKARKDLEFVTAAQMIKGQPYVIKPVAYTKEQFIEAFKGYFTPKTKAAADDLIAIGQLGDDYAELVEALIWEVGGRLPV